MEEGVQREGKNIGWYIGLITVSIVALVGIGLWTLSERFEWSSAVTEGQTPVATELTIISGSENKTLEPLIEKFNEEQGVNVQVEYQGSVDILLDLDRGETDDFDAVWPASSIVINMTENEQVKHAESILRSPVILGIKQDIAQELGWNTPDGITVQQLLDQVQQDRFELAMTNATQSNSGLSGYMAFLNAFSGSADVLELEDVESLEVQDRTRLLLNSIDRSSGSSGWLKDQFINEYESLDAMINYETLIIEANQELVEQGKIPLQAVYLRDGMVVADSPLAYVDKGQDDKEELFLDLQEYLLSNEVAEELQLQGRRTNLGLSVDANDTEVSEVFRSDWGIQADIPFVTLTYPKRDVIQEMLSVFQISLRKPSFTVYVLDTSGSMRGERIEELQSAMKTIANQETAKDYFIQTSPRDVNIVIPFSSKVGDIGRFEGNDDESLKDFYKMIDNLDVGGGTDMYTPLLRAYSIIDNEENIADYFPAIILMTDGASDNAGLLSLVPDTKDTSVFAILFGAADEDQLQETVDHTGGRVFDGRESLIDAFRKAKGYN